MLHDVSESAAVVDAARRFLETLLPDREHLDFAVFPGLLLHGGRRRIGRRVLAGESEYEKVPRRVLWPSP